MVVVCTVGAVNSVGAFSELSESKLTKMDDLLRA